MLCLLEMREVYNSRGKFHHGSVMHTNHKTLSCNLMVAKLPKLTKTHDCPQQNSNNTKGKSTK